MELGLYQTASEVGEELLSGENTSPDDILFLAERYSAGAAKTAVLTLKAHSSPTQTTTVSRLRRRMLGWLMTRSPQRDNS